VIDELDDLLARASDEEVAKTWARAMRELRVRGLVRTANTPVGDYAERICCDRFGLQRMGFSEKSVDAIGPDGTRYQIKARRLTPENLSRQLGAIRDLDKDPFDVLLAVYFDENLDLQEIWSVPQAVVKEAEFIARTNSTRFVLSPKLQKDPRITRLV
jgi:hypothetical protein